tara:strand:- start:758 stop:1210 length:453 start_codon:yes stop_codon:yes gene_type:complete
MQTSFGVRDFNIVGAEGTPTIESSGDLTIQATTTSVVGILSVTSEIQGTHPQITSRSQAGVYSLVAADAGQFLLVDNTITVPTGLFTQGEVITLYNNSANAITLTQGAGLTLRLAGLTQTGNLTLGGRGICNLVCITTNGNEIVASGNVS